MSKTWTEAHANGDQSIQSIASRGGEAYKGLSLDLLFYFDIILVIFVKYQ